MAREKNGKVIVITGGSSGIGEATALEMARDAHSFFLIGRTRNKLEKAKEKIEAEGGEVRFSVGDVSKEQDVERIYEEAIKEFGTIDVLIANAGVGYFRNLEDFSMEEYDQQMNTNVRGVFLWLRKVLPLMKEKDSGQIIVTSSNLGLDTSARASIYAATKHAVQAMVWSLREELRGTMVKAATINPGSVSTPWFDGEDVDRSKMLTPRDVALAARLIIDQSETSDIDHIHLLPSRRG
jgi:NADP-dependent 3-hydroxy acid dehydrogenase YdfG